MSLSENARERARLARINALASEIEAQAYGNAGDSRVTVVNYDIDKGQYLVKTLDGKVSYATNISGTQLGVGATVQATKKGNGFIIDYFDQGSGKSINSSSDDDLTKNAFGRGGLGDGGFNPQFPGGVPGFDPATSDGGYEPDESGACVFKTWAKGKRPASAYATAKECNDDQSEGDWVCKDGECVEGEPGQGRWKFKRECEAERQPPPFEGGQCVGVFYNVVITTNGLSNSTCNPDPNRTVRLTATGPIGPVVNTLRKTTPFAWSESGQGLGQNPVCKAANAYRSEGAWEIYHIGGTERLYRIVGGVFSPFSGDPQVTVQISRVDGQEDTCGDPPGVCPL